MTTGPSQLPINPMHSINWCILKVIAALHFENSDGVNHMPFVQRHQAYTFFFFHVYTFAFIHVYVCSLCSLSLRCMLMPRALHV